MDESTSNDIQLRTGSKTSDEFLGWDTYTEDIFKLARDNINENVKLIYNDYYCEANNGNFDGKTGAVFNYIKNMKEKEVPIDGVGLQMHVSCNDAPSYDDLYLLISRYEEIGVEVHVTEIDVTMARCNSLKDQKDVYMNIFKACFNHNNCKVFTVWGAYDTESWIGAENTPLIFDSDMYPKDIYFEMLDYVLGKLPSGATYPTPTVTSKPTTSTQTPEASSSFIIKPETYMIDGNWSNWSWEYQNIEFDEEGNEVISFNEGKYGAFSLHTMNNFNAGKFHFEMKTDDKDAPFNFIVHTVNEGEFVSLKVFNLNSSNKMESFDIEVPSVDGGYNRVSIQNYGARNVTIAVNNFFFVSTEVAEEEKDNSVSESAVYLVKPDDYMINPIWSNWSWDVESLNFDDEGNAVVIYSDGKYGAFSLHSQDIFNAAQFHFDLKTDTASASLKFLVHSKVGDEFIEIQTLSDLSTEKMKSYTIDVPFIEGGYNRVSIQNMSAKNFTIYVNNYYYVPVEEEEESVTTASTTTAPTIEQTTNIIGETTAATEPAASLTATSISTPSGAVDESTSTLEDKDKTEVTTTTTPLPPPTTTTVDDNEPEATTEVPIPVDEPEPIPVVNKCWSEELGFLCCKESKTKVKLEDINGKWGKEKGRWCGIIEELDDGCWASKIGYPCCKKKNGKIYKVNSYGSWGIEKSNWCGMVSVEECEFSKIGYTCCPKAKVHSDNGNKWGLVKGKVCGVKY